MPFTAQKRKAMEAADYIRKELPGAFEIAIILGSGLGQLSDRLEEKRALPYRDIPYFFAPSVPGHDGQLVAGSLSGQNLLIMKGRFHYYEGHDIQQVTLPVRVIQELGIKLLIVTNAAGAINPAYRPGDLMLIKDHINLMGVNPLIGANVKEWGERFPDMSDAYSKELRLLAHKAAQSLGIKLREGVYVGVSGPNYETKAEIDFFAKIGGDAVGMSTVPEVITANHGGIKTLGISCITNSAAKSSEHKITHEEVLAAGLQAQGDFIRLVTGIVAQISAAGSSADEYV